MNRQSGHDEVLQAIEIGIVACRRDDSASLAPQCGDGLIFEPLGRDFQGDGSRLDPGAADPCSHIGAKTLDLLRDLGKFLRCNPSRPEGVVRREVALMLVRDFVNFG
ncbi:hypothetical protein Maq22A_c03195 [Methylobacterium aquaticum]|uniref:Uncharacterized protein n=1 Tax=Methylobacterium aquaticum TaxID=270351 RepID=A0A0C6FB90_9HYPH|nr:hypothetical protein Maq22A_c03195 [Methylobacterium aquaticum]